MRTLVKMVMWFTLGTVLLGLVLHPRFGTIMANPMVALSLGLIGLGMIRHTRSQAASIPAPIATKRVCVHLIFDGSSPSLARWNDDNPAIDFKLFN